MVIRSGALESVVMMTTFWQDKVVLVTGHTGFKGGWLSMMLSLLGAKVYGVALPPEGSDNFYTQVGLQNFLAQSHFADLRQDAEIIHFISKVQPDVVLHLAAQPLVRQSYADPKGTYATNVMGTLNVLDALLEVDTARAIVVVTTDKCYDNKNWAWGYRESDPLGGSDPYSSSKACTEILTQSYWKSFFSHRRGVGVATARAGNVVGGGDWSTDRLIPDLVRAVQNKTQVTLRHPQATRPWQHVLDPIFGYLLLAEKLYQDPKRYSTAWNFGPDAYAHRTVGDISQQFMNHWFHAPVAAQWIKVVADLTLPEAQLLALDSTLARQQLGWQPHYGLEAMLALTVEWYQACLQGKSMAMLSTQQLQDYLERGLHHDISTSTLWTLST